MRKLFKSLERLENFVLTSLGCRIFQGRGPRLQSWHILVIVVALAFVPNIDHQFQYFPTKQSSTVTDFNIFVLLPYKYCQTKYSLLV